MNVCPYWRRVDPIHSVATLMVTSRVPVSVDMKVCSFFRSFYKTQTIMMQIPAENILSVNKYSAHIYFRLFSSWSCWPKICCGRNFASHGSVRQEGMQAAAVQAEHLMRPK